MILQKAKSRSGSDAGGNRGGMLPSPTPQPHCACPAARSTDASRIAVSARMRRMASPAQAYPTSSRAVRPERGPGIAYDSSQGWTGGGPPGEGRQVDASNSSDTRDPRSPRRRTAIRPRSFPGGAPRRGAPRRRRKRRRAGPRRARRRPRRREPGAARELRGTDAALRGGARRPRAPDLVVGRGGPGLLQPGLPADVRVREGGGESARSGRPGSATRTAPSATGARPGPGGRT